MKKVPYNHSYIFILGLGLHCLVYFAMVDPKIFAEFESNCVMPRATQFLWILSECFV